MVKDNVYLILDTVLAFIPDSISTMEVSLHRMMFYLALEPEVQMKAQKQIDEAVGSATQICLGDKGALPYLEAIIIETTRIASSGKNYFSVLDF